LKRTKNYWKLLFLNYIWIKYIQIASMFCSFNILRQGKKNGIFFIKYIPFVKLLSDKVLRYKTEIDLKNREILYESLLKCMPYSELCEFTRVYLY